MSKLNRNQKQEFSAGLWTNGWFVLLCVYTHVQSLAEEPGVFLKPDGQGINELMLHEWQEVRVLNIVEFEQKFWKTNVTMKKV